MLDAPNMPIDELPSFYPEASAGRKVSIGLDDDRKHVRKVAKRRHLHLLNVSNAAKHLGGLPELGESWHCVMRGNYHAWDLVPAVHSLACGAAIEQLSVATLGFNKSNAVELVEMFDAGRVRSVLFIASCYFRSVDQDAWSTLHEQLTARGQIVVALRCHAKIQLLKMSDGRSYVIESSANLRSCNNLEQFCISHDAGLLDFHRSWMQEVCTKGAT